MSKPFDVFQFSVATQWRIQRRAPPLSLDETEAQKAEKSEAPPPLSQGLDDQHPTLTWMSVSATAMY